MIANPSGEPGASVEGKTGPSQNTPDTATIAGVRGSILSHYDQEYLLVVRFVMRLGATRQDAEDAVQEAFADAWESLTSHPEKWPGINEFRGWIRAVARRKYLRPPGNRRQPLPIPVPEIPENISFAAIREDDLTVGTLYVLEVMRKLDRLPRAVLAFHMDGFSAPEIAIHLELRDDQHVRDLLKKARKTLARELARDRDQERRYG